ncbi:hypothetical protein EBZ37_14140, partial [bacterium]|nr:hypothetical protein [bacterium]
TFGTSQVPSIHQVNSDPQLRDLYAPCNPAWIRGQAIPFTWTAIDPECGWDDSNGTWKCSTPNWFKRFRLLNYGRSSEGGP